jgi:O-methyltransferase involved in polyketide biosynthesis
VDLGDVQRTLFFPLAARARETQRKRPLLADPKSVELARAIDFDEEVYGQGPLSFLVVIRTMILDLWVRQFLAQHPSGTVIELGTGLNTRFERTDNGRVHWIDLDLPDTIALRRKFFAETERRRMIAGSLLDEDWYPAVDEFPPPRMFVCDGVLTYLTEEQVTTTLARIARRFPGALLAFDTYSTAAMRNEHKMAAKRNLPYWQWACDDPASLQRLGLRLLERAAISRPPARLRAQLPPAYRYLLPLAHPVFANSPAISLFLALGQSASS